MKTLKNIIILAFVGLLGFAGNQAYAQCDDGSTDCYIVISGTDGYGDGWNGGVITINQGGNFVGTFTLDYNTSSYIDTFRVCSDNGPIFMEWSAGSYADEVAFTVTDSTGNNIFTCTNGATLPNGLFCARFICSSSTCPAPTLVGIDNVTSTSANVTWTGSANEYSYCVIGTGVTAEWQTTTDTTVTISNLNASSSYTVIIRSVCSDDMSAEVALASFLTACGAITLPYTENFENYDAVGMLPYCWQRLESASYVDSWSGSTTIYPTISPYSYSAHNSNSSLLIYPFYGTQSIMSPQIPAAANSIELVLWMQTDDMLEVGYVTTNDPTTAVFHHVATIGPSDDTLIDYGGGYMYTDYMWTQFTVPFDTVTTTDSIYIVLRASASIEYNQFYIDDLTIREISNCPIPTGITATSNASGEVTLNWTSESGDQWEIYYGLPGFNPDISTNHVTSNTTTATVYGLNDQLTYEFYLRTVCGTQHSYWALPVSIRPNVYAVTATVDTITSCGITITDDGGLFASATPAMQQVIVVQSDEAGRTVRIRGNANMYSGYSSSYPNVMRIFAGTDTTGTLLANINSTNQYLDITSEVGALTIWFSNTYDTYYAAEGFEFYVSCEDMADCTTPFGFEVSNILGNQATVSWQYDTTLGPAEGFTLILLDNAGEELDAYTIDGNARSYTLTDLAERSRYTVMLALECEGIDTLSLSFSTVCNSGGDMQINSGTTTTSYLPTYLYYGNTLSQQIILASELEGVGTLYGVAFYMTSSTPYTRDIDIYVDTTSLTAYTSTSDYKAPADSNRRYSGSHTFTQGWNEFYFDSGLVLPAGKNIVLTVNDHTNSYVSSTSFRKVNTSNNRSMYIYRDYNPFDPTDATAASGATLCEYYNTLKVITPCNDNSCIPPVITGTELGEDTIMLSWTPGGDESAWMVEYRHADSTAWTVATASTTATTYTFTGLLPKTTYVFRISSICGDNLAPRLTSAKTLCGRAALPFTEDFEAFMAEISNADALSECWYRGSNYPYTGSNYPYRYSASWEPEYAHSGSYSLSYGGFNAYIVLPRMQARVDSLNVSFYVFNSNPSSYNCSMEVGVCTDPTDPSTFTVVTTRETNDGDWQLVDVDLDSYTGADGHIFIRVLNSDYTYLFVDDITVSLLPDCRRVNSVQLTNITDNSATLTLVDNNNYGSYTVYYSTDNNMATADTMNITDNTVTLTGLAGNTLYNAWVVSHCSATSESTVYTVEPFYTLCTTPIVISQDAPYLFEFESGRLDCMSQESATNLMWENSTGNIDYSTYAHAISGGHMGRIASSDNSTAMLILPTFDFSQLTANAEFSFYRYHYQNTEPYYSTDPAGQLEVYYRIGTTGNWTLLDIVDTTVNTWTKYTFILPASQGAALYQVAINGKPMGNTGGIFIDDVNVKAPATCFKPVNVVVSDITDRTATISWEGGNAASYKVQYRKMGHLSWNARTTAYDSCVISPLDMATPYEVRVIGICSALDQSEPSDIVVFTSDFCENRMEANNFDATSVDATSTKAPVDLTKTYSYAEIIVDSATLAGMDELNGVSFYIDNLGGAANMNNCTIYMGHTTATALTSFVYDSNFVQVYSGTLAAVATGERRILFQNPFVWNGSDNVVIGFYFAGDYNTYTAATFGAHQAATNKLYYGSTGSYFTPNNANTISPVNRSASNIVPDLTIFGCLPTCNAPVITRVNTTESSVTVEWYNENATVQVCIKPASESAWDPFIMVDGTNRYTFTNLPGMTDFDIRVRRDCTADDNDFSDWTYCTARTDTACSIPVDVVVSNVSGTSATIGWTDGPMAGGQWEIHLWGSGIDNHYDVTSNPATIDGLAAGGSYHVAVRARCGSDNHVFGEYSDPLVFDNVCHPVSNLQAAANGNDVNLTWTPGERNTQWLVIYGYEGFTPNEMLGYQIVNTPAATIAGVGSGAKGVDDNTYAFRVRAICGDGWNSDWSTESIVTLEGIDEAADSRIALSPNPASTSVTLTLAGFDGMADVTLFGIDGHTVGESRTTTSNLTLDVSQLAAGTYFVRVQTAGWTAVRKLIVR